MSAANLLPKPAPVTMFGPDFPFAFDDWITHRAGLGTIPAAGTAARSRSSALAWPVPWPAMSS